MALNTWIPIGEANVPEWDGINTLSITTIEKITNESTITLIYHEAAKKKKPIYCLNRRYECQNFHGLMYKESLNFLLSCGIDEVYENTDVIFEGGVVLHDLLSWDEGLCQKQSYMRNGVEFTFYGTNSPVLMTKTIKTNTNDIAIVLWSTNTTTDMDFVGCRGVSASTVRGDIKPYFTHVRKMYEGTITKEQLDHFLSGVPPKEKENFKYDPLPTPEFIKSQILTLKLKNWPIHNCSFCKYRCGYIFTIEQGDVVVRYDSGCNCILPPYRPQPRLSSVDEIIAHMDLQTSKKVVDKIRRFWDPDSLNT